MIFRKSLEAIKPNGPNRIAKIGYSNISPPSGEENFISNNNYINYEQ
jgi:hypothetical protein